MGASLPLLGNKFIAELRVEWVTALYDAESELPDGPEIPIKVWQDRLVELRLESLDKPGIYVDRSPTGAGKSTADIEALRKADRGLVLLETHKQCEEVEDDLCEAGLDAVAYRGRFTDGEDQNCWNKDADKAEKMDFSPTSAVCPYCEFQSKCLDQGYIAQLKKARQARVSIATHARATYMGLEALAEGRSYIAIHEDVHTVLVSSKRISLDELDNATDILNQILKGPRWLDRFADVWDVDAAGNSVKNEGKSQRRDRVLAFVKHLVWLTEELSRRVTWAQTFEEISGLPTASKPPGIERVLFLVACETKQFAPWRWLLNIAMGKTHRIGVIARADNKRTCRNNAEPASRSGDDMAR